MTIERIMPEPTERPVAAPTPDICGQTPAEVVLRKLRGIKELNIVTRSGWFWDEVVIKYPDQNYQLDYDIRKLRANDVNNPIDFAVGFINKRRTIVKSFEGNADRFKLVLKVLHTTAGSELSDNL